MFIQAEDFVLAHAGKKDAISVYGQESNATTWRIAKITNASTASSTCRFVRSDSGAASGQAFHVLLSTSPVWATKATCTLATARPVAVLLARSR